MSGWSSGSIADIDPGSISLLVATAGEAFFAAGMKQQHQTKNPDLLFA